MCGSGVYDGRRRAADAESFYVNDGELGTCFLDSLFFNLNDTIPPGMNVQMALAHLYTHLATSS